MVNTWNTETLGYKPGDIFLARASVPNYYSNLQSQTGASGFANPLTFGGGLAPIYGWPGQIPQGFVRDSDKIGRIVSELKEKFTAEITGV